MDNQVPFKVYLKFNGLNPELHKALDSVLGEESANLKGFDMVLLQGSCPLSCYPDLVKELKDMDSPSFPIDFSSYSHSTPDTNGRFTLSLTTYFPETLLNFHIELHRILRKLKIRNVIPKYIRGAWQPQSTILEGVLKPVIDAVFVSAIQNAGGDNALNFPLHEDVNEFYVRIGDQPEVGPIHLRREEGDEGRRGEMDN